MDDHSKRMILLFLFQVLGATPYVPGCQDDMTHFELFEGCILLGWYSKNLATPRQEHHNHTTE